MRRLVIGCVFVLATLAGATAATAQDEFDITINYIPPNDKEKLTKLPQSGDLDVSLFSTSRTIYFINTSTHYYTDLQFTLLFAGEKKIVIAGAGKGGKYSPFSDNTCSGSSITYCETTAPKDKGVGPHGSFAVTLGASPKGLKPPGTLGTVDIVPSIPEPSTWPLMIGGVALVGGTMRRRRVTPAS